MEPAGLHRASHGVLTPNEGRERGGPGFYLLGLVRGTGRRVANLARGLGPDLQRVPYRDLVALVRPTTFHLPTLDPPQLLEHQRAVEYVMRRSTILPAPPGVVFRGRRPLLKFMEDQYLVLEEGLALLEGHWELRVHIAGAAGWNAEELERLAAETYGELRRHARAAVPFPPREERIYSAAFLVGRDGWIEFVERAEDLGAAQAGLVLDVTGPWPPYDFVRLVF
jgi:hypothetical protein